MRLILSFLVALLLSLPSYAQEVVQLRNGKQIAGTIVIDDQKSSEGFWIKSLETGGTYFIAWSQVPVREKSRILERPASSNAEMMDGVRIVTSSSRLVLGVLVDRSGNLVLPVPENVSDLPQTILHDL